MIASFCSPPCAVGSEGGGRAEGSLWQARRDLQWRGWRQLLPAQHSEGALVTLQAPPPRLRELGISRSGSVGRFLSSWQSVCGGSFCSTWQGKVGRVESGNDLFLFSANHKHPLFSLGIQGSLIAWEYLLGTLYVL